VSGAEKAWVTVALCAVTTFAVRAFGPIVVGGRTLGRRTTRVLSLLPAALLAALVITETLVQNAALDIDARAAGVGVAALLIWRGASVIWVVIGAAAATALLRLVF
jgi:branched-subunit amino acid transport protein